MLGGEGCGQAGIVIIGSVDLETFSFQEAFQEIDQAVIVVHDEESVHGINIAFSRAAVR